jgi:LuxR family maltose regulon positive regulatory protein
VTGSARTIERLEASNLLVVPLDRTRDWYRYHHLLQEFLQNELTRREPDIVAGLHSRAAEWFEANRMPEEAITHAQAADDGDMVARIVERESLRTLSLGRAETVYRWLRWFERTGRISDYPHITAMGGVACALSGDAIGADRWAEALPSGGAPILPAKILRALLARNGLVQVRADARAAQRLTSNRSSWGTASGLALEGLAYLWDGDVGQADSLLARAASAGERDPGLLAMTLALGGQAAIAVDHGDWDDAANLAGRSLDKIREHGFERYSTSGLTFAVATRCAAHLGQIELARRRLSRATNIRPLLTTATPGVSVHTLLEMARAHLSLSDVTGARTIVRQAAGILNEWPDLGLLPKQLEELKAQLDSMTGSTVGASALTTAELRLLPFLATHLSFPEIGERLYISRHTVKTQAMSIYRKLGASSRSEAVGHATDAGLLSRPNHPMGTMRDS